MYILLLYIISCIKCSKWVTLLVHSKNHQGALSLEYVMNLILNKYVLLASINTIYKCCQA